MKENFFENTFNKVEVRATFDQHVEAVIRIALLSEPQA
jgi:hypothetical protein